jgi:hypothetical protein
MMASKVVISLLFASAVFAGVNEDYDHVLNGKAQMTNKALDQMYEQFLKEYSHDKDNKQYILMDVDRKSVFANNIKDVIEHNSKPNITYLKGINAFSDMTDDEFLQYFHLNAP